MALENAGTARSTILMYVWMGRSLDYQIPESSLINEFLKVLKKLINTKLVIFFELKYFRIDNGPSPLLCRGKQIRRITVSVLMKKR